jgi:hypothetical protein
MNIQRRLGASVVVSASGSSVAEVFDALAQLEEIFRPRACGLCKGTNITYTLRTDREGHKYRAAECQHCHAEYRFGVRKALPAGQLFPQTKDPTTGKPKPDGGWVRWDAARANGDEAGNGTQAA